MRSRSIAATPWPRRSEISFSPSPQQFVSGTVLSPTKHREFQRTLETSDRHRAGGAAARTRHLRRYVPQPNERIASSFVGNTTAVTSATNQRKTRRPMSIARLQTGPRMSQAVIQEPNVY